MMTTSLLAQLSYKDTNNRPISEGITPAVLQRIFE